MEEFSVWCRQIQNNQAIGIAYTLSEDETTLTSLSFSSQTQEAYCLMCSPEIRSQQAFWQNLNALLSRADITKVIHNSKPFIKILLLHDIPIRNYFDTMLAHYLLEPELRHSIDLLSDQYLQYSLLPSTSLQPQYEVCCEKADINPSFHSPRL